MIPTITVTNIDTVSQLCGSYSNRRIIEQKTFYIYKRIDGGLSLCILEGIKTDPPLSSSMAEYDPERYEKVYTIPKGIIHKHHSEWIDDSQCGLVLYNGTCVILTERDDTKVIELFEKYFWRC